MRRAQIINTSRKFGAILIVSSLAISTALCAPSQQQQQELPQTSASTTSMSSSTQQQQQQQHNNNLLASQATSSSVPKPISSSSPSVVASNLLANSGPKQPIDGSSSLPAGGAIFTNSPSIVSLKNNERQLDESSMLETFDGKNPFSDDSLWQIPVHLVRDLSASGAGGDHMVKSASERPAGSSQAGSIAAAANNLRDSSSAPDGDDDDDDDNRGQAAGNGYLGAAAAMQLGPANGPLQTATATSAASSAPTVISASTTDLKTAAGYSYPSHGRYGHEAGAYAAPSYGHSSGYEGAGYGHHGHTGGDHYGGKYFQYASVPYPYAWEFGYRRGNPYHTIERYEHGKGPHFQTKVKWSDKYGGYGVHVWDYNHDDHHSHHYGGGDSYHAQPAGPHYGAGAHSGYGHAGASHYGHH